MTRMTLMRGERGAAIVWALALSCVLMVGGQLCLAMAQLTIARQQVATAADLAALAGAQTLGDPCQRAGAVAVANGANLQACTYDGIDVVVVAQVPAPALVRHLLAGIGQTGLTLRSTARAGQPGI